MRFLLFLFIAIFLITPKSFAKDGFGPLKFTEQNYRAFVQYLTGDYQSTSENGILKNTGGNPDGFAINQAGSVSYFYYCPRGVDCATGGKILAQNACTNISKKKGKGRCFVFAKGRVIVWDDLHIKIPKKITGALINEIFVKNNWR